LEFEFNCAVIHYGQVAVLSLLIVLQFSAAPSDVNHIQFRSTAAYPRSALSQPSQPKHRYYAAEHRRVESFTGARIPQGQSVAVLAAAGFFHVGQLIILIFTDILQLLLSYSVLYVVVSN